MTNILIIGYSTECTIAHFIKYLTKKEILFNFLDFAKLKKENKMLINETHDGLIITLDDSIFDMNQYTSFYLRYYYHDSKRDTLNACQSKLISSLNAYLNHTKSIVINRPYAGRSNDFKLYHVMLLKGCGFKIPESYIFGNHKEAEHALSHDKEWISKGCSGTRSIAMVLDEDLYSNLHKLKFCPSQFQKKITGHDIRVHMIGNDYVGLKISSPVTDYRYASKYGKKNKYQKITVPENIIASCKKYCDLEKLVFAGFDFKIDASTGDWYVLEANPMPGYEFFDKKVNHEISIKLGALLTSDYQDMYYCDYGFNLNQSAFITEDRIPEITPF